MARYCIKSKEVSALKKMLKNFGTIKVDNGELSGTLIVKNFRKYSVGVEVDVIFDGKAYFRYNRKPEFYSSSLLEEKVSKIKVRRILRRYLFKELQIRMKFFNLDLYSHSDIKNLTWK
jgi:hypothetical protein